MYPTKQDLTVPFDDLNNELIYKLKEEVKEYIDAIENNSNIEEEFFDVIQCLLNLSYHNKRVITVSDNLLHRNKLIERGHEFLYIKECKYGR